jgi:predicted kinase
VPGCGKTTWAKEWIAVHPWYKRVNRDLLRQMFDFGRYTTNSEKFIRKIRDELIRECLESGYSVVVDDTNLSKRDIYQITDMAHMFNRVIGISRTVAIPVRIVDFDTPLKECIRRDALREKPVGADRILVMWYKCHKINSEKEYEELRAAEKRLEEQADLV